MFNQNDVVVFQEIYAPKILISQLIPIDFQCIPYHYESSFKDPSYNILCHKKTFTFQITTNDDNYIIESSQLSPSLRPALHGTLAPLSQPTLKTEIIVVHLKAKSKDHSARRQQLNAILENIQSTDDLPALVIGDFNLSKEALMENADGKTVTFNEIKKTKQYLSTMNLTHSSLNNQRTFYTGYRDGGQLDHLWYSTDAFTDRLPAKVSGPCQNNKSDTDQKKKRFENTRFYNQFVSDHCPVTFHLKWK